MSVQSGEALYLKELLQNWLFHCWNTLLVGQVPGTTMFVLQLIAKAMFNACCIHCMPVRAARKTSMVSVTTL